MPITITAIEKPSRIPKHDRLRRNDPQILLACQGEIAMEAIRDSEKESNRGSTFVLLTRLLVLGLLPEYLYALTRCCVHNALSIIMICHVQCQPNAHAVS
jgi:hypothetical protein